MDISGMSCGSFLEALASKAPVPGGGGASALVAAIGAALGNMVGSLTLGKAKYAMAEEDICLLNKRALELRQELLKLADADAEAFAPLASAYGLPAETEVQKQEKARVMEAALKDAASVPLLIMKKCCIALEILEGYEAKGTAIAISDVGVGVACIRAALEGASLNVWINTKYMMDRAYADGVNREANTMLNSYIPRGEAIYNRVRERLGA